MEGAAELGMSGGGARVAVIGSGAMGCLFASRLAPVAEVTLLGTWREQLEVLRRRGLTLLEMDGRRVHRRFAVAEDPAAAAGADLALVLVKSHQTPRAAAWAARLLAPGGLALTLQNGLGNLELLAAAVGARRAALGVTALGATLEAPGVARQGGEEPIHLGLGPASRKRLEAAAALLRRAGFETRLAADAEALAWGKLAVNAAINPLTALLGVTNGALLEDPAARRLAGRAAAEVTAVAAAAGVALPWPDAAARAWEVCRATAANRSSMLQDLANGRRTEIDAICGAVVEHGRRLSVPTPVNAELLARVRAAEAGRRGGKVEDFLPAARWRAWCDHGEAEDPPAGERRC